MENITKKILIVDDSETNNILLKSLFDEEGYQSKVVRNGELALTHLERNTPDLILLDIMMPKMDGFCVLDKMKNSDFKIPVIIISATDDNNSKNIAKEKGALHYIEKPINIINLIRIIESVLN
jgi:two-component system response regulator VicR